MKQILILYISKGGNSKKLAERIAQGVEEVERIEINRQQPVKN